MMIPIMTLTALAYPSWSSHELSRRTWYESAWFSTEVLRGCFAWEALSFPRSVKKALAFGHVDRWPRSDFSAMEVHASSFCIILYTICIIVALVTKHCFSTWGWPYGQSFACGPRCQKQQVGSWKSPNVRCISLSLDWALLLVLEVLCQSFLWWSSNVYLQ